METPGSALYNIVRTRVSKEVKRLFGPSSNSRMFLVGLFGLRRLTTLTGKRASDMSAFMNRVID